jgi:energy-coupling factor transport system permease protein
MYEGYAVAGEIRTLADDPFRVGLWLVHGGWFTEWISGQRANLNWADAVTLWLRILAIVSTSQMWMQYVPVARFMRALFASACRRRCYLFAGPLLVVEQLKRQLAIIHEAQRARGVPLDESGTNVYALCRH